MPTPIEQGTTTSEPNRFWAAETTTAGPDWEPYTCSMVRRRRITYRVVAIEDCATPRAVGVEEGEDEA